MGFFKDLSDKLYLTDPDPADFFGIKAGKKADEAAEDARNAAQLQAQGETDKLDYLKEVEAPALAVRNQFLPKLADIYAGGEGQQKAIDAAQNSPLFRAIMGGQKAGEETILRNASVTGGLRSGNTSGALTDYGSQLQNRALLESYNQQVSGMAGLARVPLNTNAIGDALAAPSGTLAQGNLAASQIGLNQAQNQRNQNLQLAGGALALFSDIRLKDNIKYIGNMNGHEMYSWDWNNEAEELGLTGSDDGVMAHLVEKYAPEAISTDKGYLKVDYSKLNLVESEAA